MQTSDNYEHVEGYEKLPASIKARYTPKEYAWLGAEERARLFDRECYPEPEDD